MNADLVITMDRAFSHSFVLDRAEPGGLAARFALVVCVVTG
jgi:hypothetical protein